MDNVSAPPMFNSNNFFAPLLVSLAGVICASIAIFLYHFFLIKFCLRRRRRTAALNGTHGCDIATGLDPKLLDTIPTMTFLLARKCDDFRVDQTECVVCIGELEDEDLVRLLPNCRHAFHVPCIDRWFVAHSNCPVCRSPLVYCDDSKCDENESNNVGNDNSRDDLENNCDDYSNDDQASSSPSSSGVKMHSCGLLRHCASLVLPMERRSSPKRSITGLRRSLSLDQSFVINLQMEDNDQRNCHNSSSSKQPLTRSRSIRQYDIVPSRMFVSFSSRFGMRRGTDILPY